MKKLKANQSNKINGQKHHSPHSRHRLADLGLDLAFEQEVHKLEAKAV